MNMKTFAHLSLLAIIMNANVVVNEYVGGGVGLYSMYMHSHSHSNTASVTSRFSKVKRHSYTLSKGPFTQHRFFS